MTRVTFCGVVLSVIILSACTGGGGAKPSAVPPAPRAGPPAAAARAAGFDYYVLSLSWSPQHCATHPSPSNDTQCGIGHRFGFIVHGLWPQFEDGGYPSSCSLTSKPSEAVVAGVLDIMPSRTLVAHEWEKHGTCSGLEPAAYFQRARDALGRLHVPDRYQRPATSFRVTTAELHDDFNRANADVPPEALAMICNSGFLTEVRACLTKDLAPRACGRKVDDTCHGSIAVRPVRQEPGEPDDTEGGGSTAAAAEYAIRWTIGTGGPKSAKAALHVLGREPEDTDEYEVRYFDFTAPSDAPAGFQPILRDRRKGQKHELTFKYRGDRALTSVTCPLSSTPAESKREVDVTVQRKTERRSHSYSCSLEDDAAPVPVPDALHATPKACTVAMVRTKSGTLKVEEWKLANGRAMLEVSRNGADSKKALKKFRKEVAQRLLNAGIRPAEESKTELGSKCD